MLPFKLQATKLKLDSTNLILAAALAGKERVGLEAKQKKRLARGRAVIAYVTNVIIKRRIKEESPAQV